MQKCVSGQLWECCLSFNFASDKLEFHPQSAEDRGWSASIDGCSEVRIHYVGGVILY